LQLSKLSQLKGFFRWSSGLFLLLALSGVARAQINPQYQLSAPALAPSDALALAPSSSDIDEGVATQSTPQSQAAKPMTVSGIDISPYKTLSEMYYHEWSWESGVYSGGGTGLGSSSTTQFFLVGIHAGKVLTGNHFPGYLHGNFEFGGEIIPVYEVFTINSENVYGFSFKPIILRWNLVHWNKVAPFMQLAGGFLISTHELPPGNTSAFNFTPQGGFGFNFFTKPGQAVKTEFIFGHISNANLGIRNPGFNSLFLFEVGYEWLHGWRKH
jgi:lipid A 3-O-deacylase